MTTYEAATLDSNVWYHVTEARVDNNYNKTDFTSSLQVEDDNGVAVWGAVEQYWQFQPVEDGPDGRYALRCSKTGVFKQLGACHAGDEMDDSKTQPCMLASNGAKVQMWDVSDWGNGTYRFVNVKNGSDYVMDVHPGNPPFMASDLRTDIPQPGRHWLMTSVKDVDDGAYSTVFTKMPLATRVDASATGSSGPSQTATADSGSTDDASSSSSSSSSSSDLSAGAAAGIGAGVGIAVIGLGLGLFFLWWRRRRNAQNKKPNELYAEETKPPYTNNGHNNDYYYHPPPQEMSAVGIERSELDSKPVPGTTPSHTS